MNVCLLSHPCGFNAIPRRRACEPSSRFGAGKKSGQNGTPSILLPDYFRKSGFVVIVIGPVFRGPHFENGHGRILEKNFTRRQRGGIDAADAELMGWLQALENGLP